MNLTEYAQAELERAELFDPDSDYGGMLGKAAMEIVEVFATQGHSGLSARLTVEILERLLCYEPLTPLTYEPDEWIDVSEISGAPMWQNRRKFTVFSRDGGLTHYDLHEPRQS
jgi:hypothetical protein